MDRQDRCESYDCLDLAYKVCFGLSENNNYYGGYPVILTGHDVKFGNKTQLYITDFEPGSVKLITEPDTPGQKVEYVNSEHWDCYGSNEMVLVSGRFLPLKINVDFFEGFKDIVIILLTSDNDILYHFDSLTSRDGCADLANSSLDYGGEQKIEYINGGLPIEYINKWIDTISSVNSNVEVVIANPYGFSISRFVTINGKIYEPRDSQQLSIKSLEMFYGFNVIIEEGNQEYIRNAIPASPNVSEASLASHLYYSPEQILSFFRTVSSAKTDCCLIASAAVVGNRLYVDDMISYDNGVRISNSTSIGGYRCYDFISVDLFPVGQAKCSIPLANDFPSYYPNGIRETIVQALYLISQENKNCIYTEFINLASNFGCSQFGCFNPTDSCPSPYQPSYFNNRIGFGWLSALSNLVCEYGILCTNCRGGYSITIDIGWCNGKSYGGVYILEGFSVFSCSCDYIYVDESYNSNDFIKEIKYSVVDGLITIYTDKSEIFEYSNLFSNCKPDNLIFTLKPNNNFCKMPESIILDVV